MDRKGKIGLISVAVISLIIISAFVFNVDSFLTSENEVEIIGFDYEKAAHHVERLCSNGPRMSGSEEELLGAQYIKGQFEEIGLSDVAIESYEVPMFDINTVEVSLVEYRPILNIPAPMGETVKYEHVVDFVLQGYSGSLNWRDFRDDLQVVNIGNGTDLSSYDQANGKVCFVEQTADTPPNAELYFYAYDAGARAIILQNCFRGESLGYPPMFKTNQNPENYDEYPDIPFFMVSKPVGDQILDKTSGNYRIRINFDVYVGPMEIRVTVGEIKASGDTDDLAVFTAHHDTCYNTPGAIDNTVGPATLIEIARSLSKYDLGINVRFCTFGGEEEGLYGSTEYYEAHRSDLERNAKYVFNYDMAHTDRDAMRVSMVSNCNNTISSLEEISEKLMEAEPSLSDYEVSFSFDELRIKYSDYWSFVDGGATGVAAWGSGCEEYHTYLDDISHLNAESLQIEARVLGSYTLML